MLRRFISFIINPTCSYIVGCDNILWHINRIFSGVLLYFIIIIATTPLFMLLKNFNLMPDHINSVRDENLSFALLILIPIIEEIAFRLPMRYSKFNIPLSLSFLCFFIFRIFFHLSKPISNLLLIIFFSVLYYVLLRSDQLAKRIENFWIKNFKGIFYFLTMSFGLLHITNYVNLTYVHYMLVPIITINHILMGFVLGYFRIKFKYGIFYSIAIHLIINTPFYIVKVGI